MGEMGPRPSGDGLGVPRHYGLGGPAPPLRRWRTRLSHSGGQDSVAGKTWGGGGGGGGGGKGGPGKGGGVKPPGGFKPPSLRPPQIPPPPPPRQNTAK